MLMRPKSFFALDFSIEALDTELDCGKAVPELELSDDTRGFASLFRVETDPNGELFERWLPFV